MDMQQMPDTPEQGAEQQVGPEQGYAITIAVKPDGTFSVSKGALEAEPAPEQAVEGMPPAAAGGESFQSVGEMLKAVLAMVNENPTSGDDQTQFNSGFGEESSAEPSIAKRF